MVDPVKVVAIVDTDEQSTRLPPRQPDAVRKKIAEHLVRFFLEELTAGRLPRAFLPLQRGVENAGNAVLAGLGEHPDLPSFTLFTEVIQDSCVDVMRSGRLTGAVGLITDPDQANKIITSGSSDLVFLAREMLREPYWSLKAQQQFNQDPSWPLQYGYAVRRRTRWRLQWKSNLSTCQGEHKQNGLGKLAIVQNRWERNGRSVWR